MGAGKSAMECGEAKDTHDASLAKAVFRSSGNIPSRRGRSPPHVCSGLVGGLHGCPLRRREDGGWSRDEKEPIS